MTHPLGKRLPEEEAIGPTVAKVDELLTHHFGMDNPGKVIIMTQYKDVA